MYICPGRTSSLAPLNRLTNMVDANGTTKYTYTAGNQVWTEIQGPTAATVTNTYANRLRTVLTLQQAPGRPLWTNAFGYDAAGRMTNVTSPAGNFSYILGSQFYTRGPDLSGTMQGGGGIGGLLAMTTGFGGVASHYYYHADGNGNVTYLVDASQNLAASYQYDPYGNLVASSGPVAAANTYRFSSKEFHANSGMYFYLYRFYDPGAKRWPNRDPIGDLGFIILTGHVPVRGAVDSNLFLFVANKPVNAIDALGLTLWYCTVPTKGFPLFGLGRHGYLWNDATGDECGQESSCGSGSTSSNNGGPGPGDTNPTRSGRVCTQIDGSQGADASNAALMAWCHQHANDGVWVPGAHDCHNVVNKCLNHGNLGGVNPGRFGPQPIFSPIPGLSAAVP
jgi:RHS repeat-associated protein